MNTKVFAEYAEVKRKIASLQETEELLKIAVLDEMQSNQVVKEEFEFGKFSLASNKIWKYTSKIDDLDEKLKLAKIREQEKGIAKAKETKYVVFKG